MNSIFCFLNGDFPKSLNFKGQEIPLDFSTKSAISCLLFLKQKGVTDMVKADFCSRSLFGIPYLALISKTGCTRYEIDKAIVTFLSGAPRILRKENDGEKKPRIFDFVQDSGPIVAAFRQNYGLSVKEVQALHWWEFLALFENLSGDTAFESIKDIRSMKIDKKHDSPERIAEIKKAKRAVAIIDTRTKEEKAADLQAQFNSIS